MKTDYLISDSHGYWWLAEATSEQHITEALASIKKTIMTCCVIDYTNADARKTASHLRTQGSVLRCR